MTAFHLGTRKLVVLLKRAGGHSLFRVTVNTETEATSPIDRAQLYILENARGDLSLAGLAKIVGLSPRHLSRLFHAELDMSPADYVELSRVDKARCHLQHTALPIKTIAYRVGFGSTATLRRAFKRRVGVSPLEYRNRFQIAPADDEEGSAC